MNTYWICPRAVCQTPGDNQIHYTLVLISPPPPGWPSHRSSLLRALYWPLGRVSPLSFLLSRSKWSQTTLKSVRNLSRCFIFQFKISGFYLLSLWENLNTAMVRNVQASAELLDSSKIALLSSGHICESVPLCCSVMYHRWKMQVQQVCWMAPLLFLT